MDHILQPIRAQLSTKSIEIQFPDSGINQRERDHSIPWQVDMCLGKPARRGLYQLPASDAVFIQRQFHHERPGHPGNNNIDMEGTGHRHGCMMVSIVHLLF
jgi:hypothetical protein